MITVLLAACLIRWLTCDFNAVRTSRFGWFLQFFSTRARGLWQITTAELPTNRCISSLFFSGLSILIWKCERKGELVRYSRPEKGCQNFYWLLNSFRAFVLTEVYFLKYFSLVGAWDNSPLSKDSFLACWDPNWSQRWPLYYWETCQEQTEAYHSRDGWKASPWPEGCQVCGVFCTHTGEDCAEPHVCLQLNSFWEH